MAKPEFSPKWWDDYDQNKDVTAEVAERKQEIIGHLKTIIAKGIDTYSTISPFAQYNLMNVGASFGGLAQGMIIFTITRLLPDGSNRLTTEDVRYTIIVSAAGELMLYDGLKGWIALGGADGGTEYRVSKISPAELVELLKTVAESGKES